MKTMNKQWTCSFYFTFYSGGMKFSTELEYIYFDLPEEQGHTDAEFYVSGIINELYKFEDIQPQLTLYCYERRNNN